jgi:hypothetical protein
MAVEAGAASPSSPRIGDEPVCCTFEEAYAAVLAYDREHFGPEREPLARVRPTSVDPEWEIEREIAVEEAAIAQTDIEDQVKLAEQAGTGTLPDWALAIALSPSAPPGHRAFAAAYLREVVADRAYDSRPQPSRWLRRVVLVRRHERESRPRRIRRLRSRDRPRRSADDEPDPEPLARAGGGS